MRRRRQRRRTLAARGAGGLVYVAAIVWLVSPAWRPPRPQAPPAGVERPAASPTRIAVGRITPTAALPQTLPAQQAATGTTTGSTAGSSGSSTPVPQPSQPSTSGGSTRRASSKQVVGFEG